MTLQQLKYVCMVAETGKITEAAKKLYISQPSLTNAIHELEKEMNVVIFNRTNKGISSRQRGKSFWGMPDRFWNRQQYWRTNIKEDTGKRKSSACQRSIILLR